MISKKCQRVRDRNKKLLITSLSPNKSFKFCDALTFPKQPTRASGRVIGNFFAIHKEILGYFGRHLIKQFIQWKPICFGVNEWALCGNIG